MTAKSALAIIKNEINKIHTASISYRALARSDTFPLYNATQNPEFNKHLAWGPPLNIKETAEQIDLLLREITLNQSLSISLSEKNNGAWVGLLKFSEHEDSIAGGLWLHPNYWQRKISLEVGAILHAAFEKTDLQHIYIMHSLQNELVEKNIKYIGGEETSNVTLTHSNGVSIECKKHIIKRDKMRPLPFEEY